MPNLARAATPEVRGTWLTTTSTLYDHIRSGLNTPTVMADLRNIGLNTTYVETWKNGYTNFPSPTLKAIVGTTDRSTFLGSTRDLVQETLISAHRQGLIYYGWFEYGAMAQFVDTAGTPTNPLAVYMKNQGWLLQNQSGQYGNASQKFAYMNLAVPQVRQFLINMTLDAVNRYDMDGIQFDDHLGWPKDFGFDATTINLYTTETGNPAPTHSADSAFSLWRQQKVSAFAAELVSAVKTARPGIHFSFSPAITPWSIDNFNVNWAPWVGQGVFDEYVPQLYKDSLSTFNTDIGNQLAPFKPNNLDQLVMGLKINSSETSFVSFSLLQSEFQRIRSEGAAGHSLWYSAGVRETYASQLTSFYNVAAIGPAANPQFPVDQRPLPTVATSLGGGAWTVDAPAAGRYRLVAKVGSFWTEIAAVDLDAGPRQFNVSGATQVELLVDRRTSPTFLGDFAGNLAVDGIDFLTWQRGFNQANALPSTGDATHDGKVTAVDLLAWNYNFGRLLSPVIVAGSQVPEPSALALILCLVVGRWAHQRKY